MPAVFHDQGFRFNRGFSARTLARLLKIVEARRAEIDGAWNDYFA